MIDVIAITSVIIASQIPVWLQLFKIEHRLTKLEEDFIILVRNCRWEQCKNSQKELKNM